MMENIVIRWQKRSVLLLMLTLSPLASWAYTLSEPVERTDWPIEYRAPPEVEFLNVKVMQEKSNSIYLSGRVRRAYESGLHGGYVNVELFAPGSAIAGFSHASPYLPLASHHRSFGDYFRIDIPLIPAKNSKILLHYIKKER